MICVSWAAGRAEARRGRGKAMSDWNSEAARGWILVSGDVRSGKGPSRENWDLGRTMLVNCEIVGCKARVPQQLEEQKRCLLHFTLDLEQTCMQMRRETATGQTRRERYDEMRKYMAEHGQKLAQLATGGASLTDETKARILSTFLTLMNCRENIERVAARQENERRIG